MTEKKYNKIVLLSAWYDLLVTAPFAVPFTAKLSIENLTKLHTLFNFDGSIPSFEPLHYFFINLMGSIVVVWSVLRIKHTTPLYGLYDTCGRAAFSLWMIYYLGAYNVTSVVMFVLTPEMIWGLIQGWGYYQYKQYQSVKGN